MFTTFMFLCCFSPLPPPAPVPPIFFITGCYSSEVIRSVYSKPVTERFPGPHSQHYSCTCDLTFRITGPHTEITAVCITGAKRITYIFYLKGLFSITMPTAEMMHLVYGPCDAEFCCLRRQPPLLSFLLPLLHAAMTL